MYAAESRGTTRAVTTGKLLRILQYNIINLIYAYSNGKKLHYLNAVALIEHVGIRERRKTI